MNVITRATDCGRHCRALRVPALLIPVMVVAAGGTAATTLVEVRLGEHSFDWTTVENDRAHFAWTATVVNDTRDDVIVQVSVDLLDDDDSVVTSDSVEISVAAGETRTARHESAMDFGAAAGVVSFRFRLQPRPAS